MVENFLSQALQWFQDGPGAWWVWFWGPHLADFCCVWSVVIIFVVFAVFVCLRVVNGALRG